MIKVSIVDRTPHTRLNGVARYMLGITSLANTNDWNIDLRVLFWGQQKKATDWHQRFQPKNHHSKLNHINRTYLRILGQHRYRPDIVHYPYHYLPKDWANGPGKKIITVHGASAFSQNLYDPDRGESIKHNLHKNLSKIEQIITVSEWSKTELIKHLKLPESRITVIPNGVDLDHFSAKNAQKTSTLLAEKFALTQPYILHLGPAQPRKNLLTTIKAFTRVKQALDTKSDPSLNDLKLVLSGLPGQDTEQAKALCDKLNITKDIQWLGKIEDSDLPYLYSGAKLFVFPSLYEGFGIPLLESMACNTPVVTSNTSAMPEVVDEAGLLVNPLDETELAEACLRLLTDTTLYQSMQQKGLKRAQQFTWQHCAERHMVLYQKIAETP